MKRTFLSICFGLLSWVCMSQVPNTFNYQATVRDDNGLMINQIVDIKVVIEQNDQIIYEELHPGLNTGILGKINFNIGSGVSDGVLFSDIDWSQGGFKVEVWMNDEPIGSTPLSSVPFANYSLKSETDNDWKSIGDSILFVNDKNVGIGLKKPDFPLHINSDKIRLDGISDADFEINIPDSANDWPSLRFLIDNKVESVLQLRHTEKYLLLWESLNNTATSLALRNGKIGANVLNPKDQLHVRGVLRLEGFNAHQKIRLHSHSPEYDNRITSYDENGNLMWVMMMGRRAYRDRFEIDRPGNSVTDFYIDPKSRTHVRTLEIHGGSDITEGFNSLYDLEPGDIVVIDESNEGQLKRTDQAYDRKVVGVISGANGINPGVSLSQEEVLDGEYPLAVLGRVYVKVTGKVEVGDLLTTSNLPGHAMTAMDFEQSRGAVVGKALSSNNGKEGLVLVLIQPQ